MQKIAESYLSKTKYSNNFAIATAIFQYLCNMAKVQQNQYKVDYFLQKAYNVEELFLHHISTTHNYDVMRNIIYKEHLFFHRNKIKQKCFDETIQNSQHLYKYCMDMFVNNEESGLYQIMIKDCIKILGRTSK